MKKEYRVKRNEDFSEIISKKNSFANQSFVVYYAKNDVHHARIGISVSKRLGNAVVRNKIKRQVRMMVQEIFDFQQSLDYVIIIRNKYIQFKYEKNKQELAYVYEKINKRMGK